MTDKQRLERIAEIAKTQAQTILAFPDAMARLEKIHELCAVDDKRSREGNAS